MGAVAQHSSTYPFPAVLRSILRPRSGLTVSEWCDRYRLLHGRHAATPGRWSTSYTPYLREPMDAFADPNTEAIVFMKCSRVGGTEMANNLLAWSACERPMPTGYVQPEKEDVEEEMRGRIKGVFEGLNAQTSDGVAGSDGVTKLRSDEAAESETSSLRHSVTSSLPILIPPELEASGYWCLGTKITLTTMDIYGAWMTNPGTLKRRTWGQIFVDEIDNAEAVSGRMGNTFDFLLERIATYGHRGKVYVDSTPAFEEGSGWQFLLSSDYRKPYVPCPGCGTYQVLKFAQIKLKPGHEHERDPERIRIRQLAAYQCEACGSFLEHRDWHRWMIDRVVWIPSRATPGTGPDKLPAQTPAEKLPVDDARIVKQAKACGPPGHQQWKPKLAGDAPLTRRRGYWINALYSPWRSRTWSHILARFFECKSDREKLRVFQNSWLAEPWRDAVEKTDIEVLRAKKEKSYPGRTVPAEAKILLMGADVQLHEIYFVIRAWGPWERSWLVYEDRCTSFDQLYELAFYTGFPVTLGPGEKPTAGGLMRCHAMAIDSRYRTDEVYEFAARPGVTAVRGVTDGAFRTRPSKVEFAPDGRPLLNPLTAQVVNTSYFKTHVARLMNLPPGHRSYWGLHADTREEYLEQVTAEHQVRRKIGPKKSKRWALVWEPKTDGAANHWLDAEVYGAALADICKVPLLREHSMRVGLMAAPGAGGGGQSAGGGKQSAKPGAGFQPGDPGRGWLR